jgi:hypothetical protein
MVTFEQFEAATANAWDTSQQDLDEAENQGVLDVETKQLVERMIASVFNTIEGELLDDFLGSE